MKLKDLKQRQASHVIIFGDSKVGKSTIVSKLASKFKLLWFSCDNGHEVLFKLPPEAQENIEIIVLPDTKEFPVAITTVLKVVSGQPIKICEAHGQTTCSNCLRDKGTFTEVHLGRLGLDTVVVFDHLSGIGDSAMNFITKKMADDYKPEWEDFRVQGALLTKVLLNIQQAPYNVVCIAHSTETEMEDKSKKLVPRVGTVPFSKNVGSYFDHIIYSEMVNKVHKFGSMTTYKTSVITGSRKDIAIESDKEPSLIPFFNGEILKQEVNGQDKVASVAAQIIMQSQQQEVPQAAGVATSMHAATQSERAASLLAKLKGK